MIRTMFGLIGVGFLFYGVYKKEEPNLMGWGFVICFLGNFNSGDG